MYEDLMDKPLEGMSAILASPTYGAVDAACVRDLRVAVMTAAARGLHWVGDASADKMAFGWARNAAVFSLRKVRQDTEGNTLPTADGIMWVDSDIRMKPDSIVRLLTTVRSHNLDFVTGVYHSRKPHFLPVLYHRVMVDIEGKPMEKGRYLQVLDYPKDTIISADASGFGFCYTSAKAIETIASKSPDFTPKGGWFPDLRDGGGYGEDIAFCHQAWKSGVQLFVDTGVQVGHTGDPQVVWEEDFRKQGITIDDPRIQKVKDNDWGSLNSML
jgi:hypothetical protein